MPQLCSGIVSCDGKTESIPRKAQRFNSHAFCTICYDASFAAILYPLLVDNGYHRMEWQIIRSGNRWCAIGPDFENLETSPVGWGDSPIAARQALDAEYRERFEPLSVPPLEDFAVRP